MHVITGFFVVVLVLHLSGLLMPLIYATVTTFAVGLIWVIAKSIHSSQESGQKFRSTATHYVEPKDMTWKSAPPIPTARTVISNGLHRSHLPNLRVSVTNLNKTFDIPTSGLIIKLEPLEKILNGKKVWEMRSITTKKRGAIALIGKGSKRIMGIATIVDVQGPLSDAVMVGTEAMHQIAPTRLDDADVQKLRYAWVLSNVTRLDPPVAYVPRRGAVRFVDLTTEEMVAINSRLQAI